MAKKLLKVYGERNTGTNYLSKLVDLNLQVKQLPGVVPQWLLNAQEKFPRKELVRDVYFTMTFFQNLGWKHTQVKPAEEICKYAISSRNLSFITLTKNPYSWLFSLYRKPYHQDGSKQQDFEAFLTAPWGSVGRENVAGVISNPVELWNIKNASYIQLAKKLPALTLRFEDLLEDPQQVLESISAAFSLKWKVDKFINFDQSTKESSKDSNFYRDYYLNEQWKAEFSPQITTIINKHLNERVMNYFHYEKWVA